MAAPSWRGVVDQTGAYLPVASHWSAVTDTGGRRGATRRRYAGVAGGGGRCGPCAEPARRGTSRL